MVRVTPMAPVVARSTMELMLESIRMRDEQPLDEPPALPARPSSRGRRPTARRSLPSSAVKHTAVGARDAMVVSAEQHKKADELPSIRRTIEEVVFRSDIPNCSEITGPPRPEESPNANVMEEENGDDPALASSLKGSAMDAHGLFEGSLSIQKHFRGLRARRDFHELKRSATTLQSYIRGEIERSKFHLLAKKQRAAILIQKHVRRWIGKVHFCCWQRDAVLLQSAIRSFLVRKHYLRMNNHMSASSKMKENGEECDKADASVVSELRSHVKKVECALKDRDEENTILRQQLVQYQRRWAEYEARMKSMEETWQNQLLSLQMSLAAAKKVTSLEEMLTQPQVVESPMTCSRYESEDGTSAGTRTPEPIDARLRANRSIRDHTNQSTIDNLAEEFEHKRQAFEVEADYVVAANSSGGRSRSDGGTEEDFQRLKEQFKAWKRGYKARLKEVKASLVKLSNHDRKRWWLHRRC